MLCFMPLCGTYPPHLRRDPHPSNQQPIIAAHFLTFSPKSRDVALYCFRRIGKRFFNGLSLR